MKRVLEDRQIWSYFVFPQIEFQPKGQVVARLIETMGLRAENVLFLDDNPQNREEVRFTSPSIHVAGPSELGELLDHPALEGRPDESLTRLNQYHLLEAKNVDASRFESDHETFLRQCDIRVSINEDCRSGIDRIAELIQRTNQLNFTKKRIGRDEVAALVADPDVECGSVRVEDRYGDYGIAGFYAMRNGTLEHLLFSCRVLNMGVEAWVFDSLGRPALDIRGDVVGDPRASVRPDWIRASAPPTTGTIKQPTTNASGRGPRMLLRGGCDLDQVIDFLGQRYKVPVEFNYVSAQERPCIGTTRNSFVMPRGI